MRIGWINNGPLLSGRNQLVHAFVAVVQIGSRRVALCFPKQIGGIVVFENQSENLLDAFLLQRLLGHGDQTACDAHAAAIRMDTQVVDDATTAVMAAQNDADDLAVYHGCKAGGWVAFQLLVDSVAAVIDWIQRPAALFRAVP